MRIIYVAKQHKGCNDNEGAIRSALTRLGHRVDPLDQNDLNLTDKLKQQAPLNDLLLFQKWSPPRGLLDSLNLTKVVWYFDLVQSPDRDRTLLFRDNVRTGWMERILPQVDLMFCSDGDFVERSGQPHKVRRLTQGADGRNATYSDIDHSSGILFMGSQFRCGWKRRTFVDSMRKRYGMEFQVKTNSYNKTLHQEITQASIVVAPDYPVTDSYYSNRIYVVLSNGGFLLHPYSRSAAEEYTDGEDLVFYRDRSHLYSLIEKYRSRQKERDRIRLQGYKTTLDRHTYDHRCETLIRQITGDRT